MSRGRGRAGGRAPRGDVGSLAAVGWRAAVRAAAGAWVAVTAAAGDLAGQAGGAAAAEEDGEARGDLPGEVRWLDGPAGRLRVVEVGAADGIGIGPGVLFVHSLAGSLEHWEPQLRHLDGRRRAAALDLRGHGGSEAPERVAYGALDLSEDVTAAVEGLELSRVVLVGHSLGAAAIAAYAARHPERVAGLLFVDPVGDQRQATDELVQLLFELDREYAATVEGYWTAILEGSTPETRRLVMADLRKTPPEAVIRSLEGLLYFEPAALLADYGGPMRAVVTPLNDLPLSLHRVVPGLEAVTVTGTSHWLQLDRPSVFHRHLDDFLRRVDEVEGAGSAEARG